MTHLSAKPEPFLLRNPTLSEDHIGFCYGGNIWIADRDGSALRRLTSMGYESGPALSPDGTQIAFIGEYEGPRGVFVMPVVGGEPRRLTWHPDDLGLVGLSKTGNTVGWAPDGKTILFSSRRKAFAGGSAPVVQLFTIPLEGGSAECLPLVRAAEGAFSPDAKRMAYVPNTKIQPDWKRYQGGQTTAIWIAELASSDIEVRIPRENSNDFNPIWVGDTIYFLSDRNGPVTIFAYDLKAGKVRQVVENNGLDIKSASACLDAMVYEQFGALHLLNLRSGEDRVLDLRPVADFPEVRSHLKNLSEIITTDSPVPEVKPMISSRGEYAAFGVRGRILSVPADGGEIRTLTAASGVVEREPAWSPDGKFIAYFCDESGEYALHIRDHDSLEVVYRIELGDAPSYYYSPLWAPDGRKIAYVDKHLNSWYVDLVTRTPVRVDTDLYVDPPRLNWAPNAVRQLAWSPDSRWIAYTKVLESHFHAVLVHSIEQGKNYSLTDGMSDVLHVVFDKGGDYLYFTASTDVGLSGDWMATSSLRRPVTRSVYALVLREGTPSPLVWQGSGAGVPTTSRKSEQVDIDLEGVGKRIVRLPLAPGYYMALFAGHPGTLFCVDGPQGAGYGHQKLQNLHRLDLATGNADRILRDVIYVDLSFDGKKLLYARVAPAQRRQWFIAPVSSVAGGSDSGMLRVDSAEVLIDPRAEWNHIYEQAWRAQRHFLYDRHLHGLDLEKMHRVYAPFLENIVTRADLDYLLAEMLGNLTVGHLWVHKSPEGNRKPAKIGLLGADYEVERGRYRFARIYEADPWRPAGRAPLCEPGREVRVGEYLLAVDGREVFSSADLGSYFKATADKRITLRVGPQSDGSGARAVSVTPLVSEYALRYFAWVEGNRRKVDELSEGRVAYVHVPDCNLNGYEAFNRYFFAQVNKQAAIIDVRYNTGGWLPDYFIDCLRRSLLCYWSPGEGRDFPSPSLSLFGPKVMLINEMSMSMGDVLPWMFRRTGLGPLIGKRTWGGAVGVYTYPADTLDDGAITTPNLAFYTPEGAWEIENAGVPPDVEVEEDPKAARAGRDAQLERAVETVMDLLKKNSLPVPQRPPYPRFCS